MLEFGQQVWDIGKRQASWLGGLARLPAEQAPRATGELLAGQASRAYSLGTLLTRRTLLVGKPLARFSIGFVDELVMTPRQQRYLQDLPLKASQDRVNKAIATAQHSLLSNKLTDVRRGEFAALDLAAGIRQLAKLGHDDSVPASPTVRAVAAEAAIEAAPLVGEIVAMLPDTERGQQIAEQLVTLGTQPAVDNFNEQVVALRPKQADSK